MYSPTKQAQDQDPQGVFIRRWVPELGRVPLPYLAEPWKMDVSVQRMAGCTVGVDYPLPIVDDKAAMKAAKERMYGLRKTEEARQEAGAVQSQHGSRKRGLPPSGKGRKAASPAPGKRAAKEPSIPSPQGDLFN
jgi:deoxyribodipyrimidine photo-lyase